MNPVAGCGRIASEMKEGPELRQIPVVVLTTSEAEADVLDAYQKQASSYIVKPVDFDFRLTFVRRPGQ